MTDTPYLIAHKVRGEPAFDIAIQMEVEDETWWIIPTSGHRAYPYFHEPLSDLVQEDLMNSKPPPNLPDHYEVSAAPKGQGSGLDGRQILAKLGLRGSREPLVRRV